MLHKRSYQSTGSYIRVFSVLSTRCLPKGDTIYRFLYTVFNVLPTRCHKKNHTNLQVLIYGFLVYCLPGNTQKVLPIYMFLYMGFYCIVYQVSYKMSYQFIGSYTHAFTVLSTRCHTKGPNNLQVLIQGLLLYCLQGVIQEVLPIYRFLYMGF